MSYLIAEDLTDLRIDFLEVDNGNLSTTMFSFISPSAFNTDIQTTATNITLYSGSSYYLECSPFVQTTHQNGAITWQFYDETNSTFIGQNAYINLATNIGAAARIGRRVCSALVLNSDIEAGKSIDVGVRIVSITGSGWLLDPKGVPGFIQHVGWPTVRIMQLPS